MEEARTSCRLPMIESISLTVLEIVVVVAVVSAAAVSAAEAEKPGKDQVGQRRS